MAVNLPQLFSDCVQLSFPYGNTVCHCKENHREFFAHCQRSTKVTKYLIRSVEKKKTQVAAMGSNYGKMDKPYAS